MTAPTPWIKNHGQPATLERLKDTRLNHGFSQATAGQLIGKTASHFGKIERGEVGLTAQEALTLCRSFGLTLAELLQVND